MHDCFSAQGESKTELTVRKNSKTDVNKWEVQTCDWFSTNVLDINLHYQSISKRQWKFVTENAAAWRSLKSSTLGSALNEGEVVEADGRPDERNQVDKAADMVKEKESH